MTLFELIKSIIITILFLCIAPDLMQILKKHYMPLLEPKTNIGTITIADSMHNSDHTLEQLHTFFKDQHIKGIIIKLNCTHIPAGTSQTLFHDMRYLKKEYPKPLIALVENTCIAGAYLIASSCDYIIAPESALIGGIGTSFNTECLEKIDKEKYTNLENIITDSYQQLTKQIAQNRKLSLTTTSNWAEGKIFTATQALAVGLINEIGSMYSVIKIMKEKALIENDIEWISISDKPFYMRFL
jgi:protease IV